MWSKPDYVDWDARNVQHIEAAEVTQEEVESVLDEPDGEAVPSDGAPDGEERWIIFGMTTTGKHIAVVFEILCEDPFYVRPVTAYETPEYGDAD
jgi:uncharacterized DUF497 family protein